MKSGDDDIEPIPQPTQGYVSGSTMLSLLTP